jgi:hypothetical protein
MLSEAYNLFVLNYFTINELIAAWKSNAKRPKGPSRQRRADRIKEDLKMLGAKNAEEMAKDREKWKQYVVAAMGLKGL